MNTGGNKPMALGRLVQEKRKQLAKVNEQIDTLRDPAAREEKVQKLIDKRTVLEIHLNDVVAECLRLGIELPEVEDEE